MNKFLVDTNVLVRLIAKDDKKKFQSVLQLVERVDKGEMTLIIPTITIAECCWLFESFYKLDKSIIAKYLIDILESENVEAEDKDSVEILKIYGEKNVDFADSLLSVKSSNRIPVLTWDKKDFKKLNCEFYSPDDLR
ncbi:PIN domain-containing protein [Bacillus dakarensis]|uniref:PIN domain-containing protein n=1 Tax=Robertmurraya dakarensis TaxID=1926278 RepID=UPI0009815578|nr:PIN domain-containing protein [Bacillus dakarensis]